MGVQPLLTFAAVALVVIVIPGPSVLFIVSRALTLGRAAAIRTVLGNAAGEYLQVVAVAVGIGAVIERSVLAFAAVKLVGATVLVLLGLRTIRHRRRLARTVAGSPADPAVPTGRRIVAQGLAVGATNPKTAVVFAAVLPQFVDRAAGQVPLQLLALGLVWVAIALVTDTAWGLVAGRARSWFTRSPQRMDRLGGAAGVVMVGLGVGVGLTARGG